MKIVNCECIHNKEIEDISSRCLMGGLPSIISYNSVRQVNNYCLHYSLPYDLRCKIFIYANCISMYHLIYNTKQFRAKKDVCIFGCIYTSHLVKYNIADYTHYNDILCHIINMYNNPESTNIYDIPKTKLIESNNVLAHYIVLIQYILIPEEILYLFNTWQGELECCTSPVSMALLKELIPNLEDKNDNNEKYVLDFLYKTIYDTQDITPLYNVIEQMEITAIDDSIVKQFQIPPFLMEKLVDIIDVNDMATYQLYIDKKLIMDNFSQFTEESLTKMIDHAASSDEEVLDQIIEQYPQLFSNIIRNNLATINQICTNKIKISKEDWIYISQNYDIPNDKILSLSRFLNYKLFIVKRRECKNNKVSVCDIDWSHKMMEIMTKSDHFSDTSDFNWPPGSEEENENCIEYQIANEIELDGPV